PVPPAPSIPTHSLMRDVAPGPSGRPGRRSVAGGGGSMSRFISFLTGAHVGMGTMYLFDPDAGKRRRAHLRDKGGALVRDFQDGLRKSSRDLKHRAFGRVADF